MAKVKYTIELDEQIVDNLKKQFQSVVEKIGSNLSPKTIENFLEQIIEGYIKTGDQIKDLGSKFGDIFSKIGDLGDLDLEKLFGGFSTNKKNDDKKEEPKKDVNLKN